MNEEGVAALLGFALLTTPEWEVRVSAEIQENGLPENHGLRVYKDEVTDELVIKIEENKAVKNGQ